MEVASILFFILVVIYFSFSLTLAFVSKKLQKKGLGYLYLSFLLQALILLAPALLIFRLDISFSAYITGPIKVIITPLLYIYIKKLSQKNKRLTSNEYWHFLPFVLDCILTLIIAPGHASEIVRENNEGAREFLKIFIDGNFYFNVLAISARTIALAQGLYYSFLIYKLYQKYALLMHQNISEISPNNLFWIRFAAILVGVKGVVSGGELFGVFNIPLVFVAMFIFMASFGFYFFNHAMVQPDISFLEDVSKDDPSPMDLEKDEPETDLHVLELFKERKLFLNPTLTLQEASDDLYIPKYRLTKSIKDGGYQNFYAFVNEQRIQYSKELLRNLPENLSLESVVGESGFQARSTYYRVFKELTGLTPKEYIANSRSNNS